MDDVREEWLATTQEAALEPDLEICDPHHHLWTHRGRYLLDEFLRDAHSGHRIVSSVFVACDAMYRPDGPVELRPVGETEFVEKIANECERDRRGPPAVAAGIVGFADLALGDGVARVLDAHLEASPTRFRGVRHSVTWDPSSEIRNAAPNPKPGWLLDTTFRRGVACLHRYGLSFEGWLFHTQLAELASLARAFPDLPIILNHIGGPLGVGPYAGKRDEVYAVWKRGIAEVAACPNVVVKLGGLGMPRAGYAWNARPAAPTSLELATAARPYFMECIDRFGTERCMFASNFPSDKVSYSYWVVWNAFKRVAKDFSTADRRAMFHDNATRVYRLADVVARSATSPDRAASTHRAA